MPALSTTRPLVLVCLLTNELFSKMLYSIRDISVRVLERETTEHEGTPRSTMLFGLPHLLLGFTCWQTL